jgi:four helix bundle protein
VGTYQDLQVWQRAVELSAEIYRETRELKDFGFRDQLTRSGLSIASNIAEGFERDSDAEIAQFLKVAKGSAGEVRTQAIIGMKAGLLNETAAKRWIDESAQIGRMIGALIKRHRANVSS